MASVAPRVTPPVKRLRVLFRQHPSRSNQDWADEWGVTRERVRQIRSELGLPPFSQIRRQISAENRERRRADEAMRRARLSDRLCPVCQGLVPVLRRLTCSPKCAHLYRTVWKYRAKRQDRD